MPRSSTFAAPVVTAGGTSSTSTRTGASAAPNGSAPSCDAIDTHGILSRLDANGVGLLSTTEPHLDTTSLSGRFIVGMVALIAERVSAGVPVTSEQGQWYGRVPFGYRLEHQLADNGAAPWDTWSPPSVSTPHQTTPPFSYGRPSTGTPTTIWVSVRSRGG